MKLIKIFFITLLLTSACLQNDNQQDEFKNSSLSANQGVNSQNKDNQGIFDYTFSGNKYDISCVDNVLEINRANEIFDEGKAMTNQEIVRVSHCVVDQKTESFKNEKKIQSNNIRIESVWIPSPNDLTCADRVMGIEAFRAIYDGERLPTKIEEEAWKECPPEIPLDEVAHPLAHVECPSLEQMWEVRYEFVARWDQIECHTGSLERYDLPEFRAHDRFPVSGSDSNAQSIWPFSLEELLTTLDATDWKQYDRSQYVGRDQDLWRIMELLENSLSGNLAIMPMSAFPPYLDDFRNLMQYPPDDYWHDKSLRVFALYAIQRKRDGHPIEIADHYPDGMQAAPANNVAEFREWIDKVFVPQKIHEATIAELLKAEILIPFPLEIERWIQVQPWAKTTSTQEKVATAQYVLDHVYNAVRPIFKGKLDVESYANYLPDRDGSGWKNLVFTDYDEVSFNLFPECDLEFSVMYTQNQMKHVMDIVLRDDLKWWIHEWDFKNNVFEGLCGTNMEEEAASIMEAMLDIIFAQPVQPFGIDYIGPIFSAKHLEVIEDRIFSK